MRRTASLRPGEKILVWYDPSDPQDVLVYGREGRGSDRLFIIVGVLYILGGMAIAAIGG